MHQQLGYVRLANVSRMLLIAMLQVLRKRERDYEHEMENLAREKIAAQQRLLALKKELTATWDHIDFNTLLPEQNSATDVTATKSGEFPRTYYFQNINISNENHCFT